MNNGFIDNFYKKCMLTVFGSTALDTIRTPKKTLKNVEFVTNRHAGNKHFFYSWSLLDRCYGSVVVSNGQSSVRYFFFVIATATATFPKNVIATVIATFLKKVIATLLANFSLNHRYIFATFSLLLLFKIEKKLTYNF